jgi:hypothetical protein
MKSKLVKVLVVLFALAVLAVVGVVLSLDSIIKSGVERVGPHVTKVEVKLDGVNLLLFAGKGSLKGLIVGNPEGYKTPSAIKVGKATMTIDTGSVLKEKAIIRSINLEAPEITLEGNLGGNNLTKILANIQAFTAAEKTQPATTPEGKPQKKIQVDEFVITGAKVNLSLDMSMIGGKNLTVPIPDIRLTDLGKGENGITPAELSERVMKEVLAQTTVAATKAVADLGKVGLDAAKGLSKDAVGEAEKKVKGIGDLFKKK